MWVDTYNAAKAAGKIPSFAPAVLRDGVPYYPSGTETGERGVCSWSSAHCFGEHDISDAPDGMYGVNFDDGVRPPLPVLLLDSARLTRPPHAQPVPASLPLYDFLEKQNQTATHFLIGTNVVDYPDAFKRVLDIGGHVAVHTWSHPLVRLLSLFRTKRAPP